MLEPGHDVPLTEAQRDDLANGLDEVINDLEAENANLIADTGVWWEWYDAVPDTPIRSDPWDGASNLVVPLIKMMADSLHARSLLVMFSSKNMWTGSTHDEEFFKPRLANILTMQNYGATRQLFDPLNDGVLENFVLGESHYMQRWMSQERYVIPPNARTAAEFKPIRVMMNAGPWVDYIPRERILYPFGHDPRFSEIVVLQHPMSWPEIARNVRLNGWDEAAAEQAQTTPGIAGPGGDVMRTKRQIAGLGAEPASTRLDSHDVRSCYVDWPMFKSLSRRLQEIPGVYDSKALDIPVRLIVTQHKPTKQILKVIYDPHPMLEGWPIYRSRYRNAQSKGLAKALEHMQRGRTTLLNQSIDAITLANSIKAVTSDAEFARKQDFTPNRIPWISDVTQLKELGAQKQVFPDLAIGNQLHADAERTAGQSDPNLGRETRLGGHPQPATNFLGLQENSQVLNTLPMKNLRKVVTMMGEDRWLLLQRHERNRAGWIQKTFGAADGDQIQEALETNHLFTGNVTLDVHALSEIHNPQGEMQKAVLIDQVTSNYYVKVAKYLEVTENPQAPPALVQHLRRGAAAAGETLKRFLEAAEVDEIEKFVETMVEGGNSALGELDKLAGAIRESAQGQAPGASGPVPGGGVAALPAGAGALPVSGNGAGGAGGFG